MAGEQLVSYAGAGEVSLGGGGTLVVSEHARMSYAGLELDEGTGDEELAQIAESLGVMLDAGQFAVGDYANFLKRTQPQVYRQWIDRPSPIKGLDSKTVKVYAAVSAFYPMEQRMRHLVSYEGHPGVSHAHFSALRQHGAEVAEYWLGHAAAEGWALEEMSRRIEGGTPGSDDAPPLPEGTPSSTFGQAYWLGPPEDPERHLLLCGDATRADHLALITHMGARATMLWTDPPYGVEYVGKTEDALTIQNDGADDLYALLCAAWAACAPALEDCAPFYVAGPTGDNALAFLQSFAAAGWRYKQMLVWVKNTMVLGRQDHQLKHEGLYYGNAPGTRVAGRMSKDRYRWYGGDGVTSVFEVDKPTASRDHPTMKPVKLIIPGIENCSREGEVVLDPFAGSGSTLIAADQLGRRCFAVEYDPAYCDVIRRRYVEYLEKRASGLIAAAQDEHPVYEPGPFEE